MILTATGKKRLVESLKKYKEQHIRQANVEEMLDSLVDYVKNPDRRRPRQQAVKRRPRPDTSMRESKRKAEK